MTIIKCTAFIATVAVGFTLATAVAAADADDVIAYRQGVMDTIGGHMTALGLIAQGKVAHKDAFAAHAAGLAQSATLALDAFRENTDGKGKKRTTSKGDVWSKWGDFEKGFKTLETQTAALSQLAAAGDIAGASAKIADVGKTCKSCHSSFRSR